MMCQLPSKVETSYNADQIAEGTGDGLQYVLACIEVWQSLGS